MPLVLRHKREELIGSYPLGTDQNRFDVEDYWDRSLQVPELSKSVCMFVKADHVKNLKQGYVPQPGDALGDDGFVIQPEFKTYEESIRSIITASVERKIEDLVAHLSVDEQRDADREKLERLPWPGYGPFKFESKFSGQPVYGFASGFMAGPNIVATAAHAINFFDRAFDINNVKIVFNLRAVNAGQTDRRRNDNNDPNNNNNNSSNNSSNTNNSNKTIGGGSTEGSRLTYIFDKIYDIRQVMLHGEPPWKLDTEAEPLTVPEYISHINKVGAEPESNMPYNFCILRVAPTGDNNAKYITPALKVVDYPFFQRNDPPPGDCFVIGAPHGLSLKISGHARDKTFPKILTAVEGFHPAFACDVDVINGNSGGPIFYRDGGGRISVVGLCFSTRARNWGLSSDSSKELKEKENPLREMEGTLSALGGDWVAEKIKAAKSDGRLAATDKTLYLVDKAFWTSFAENLSYYEKEGVVDIRRFSEYSPVWKSDNLFVRADFIKFLTTSLSSWNGRGKSISMRVNLNVDTPSAIAGAGAGAVKPTIQIVAASRRVGDTTTTPWTGGDVPLQAGANPGAARGFRTSITWTSELKDGNQKPAFRDKGLILKDGQYLGDINPNMLANDTCVANWDKLAFVIASKSKLPDDLRIGSSELVIEFRDATVMDTLTFRIYFDLEVLQKTDTKITLVCNLTEQTTAWIGPQTEGWGVFTSIGERKGAVPNDGVWRENRTVVRPGGTWKDTARTMTPTRAMLEYLIDDLDGCLAWLNRQDPPVSSSTSTSTSTSKLTSSTPNNQTNVGSKKK